MSKNKNRTAGGRRQRTGSQQYDKNVAVAAGAGGNGPADNKAEKGKSDYLTFGSFREIIESVAIAFVLAFLFRTFEAEAFVIPTGSMATTLMGRHKDVTCPQCGYPYTVSASEEVDSLTGEVNLQEQVHEATCPMCRYHQTVSNETSFNGDRILVSKFDYQLNQPERWDVTVFMYPGDAKTNFIKRLVGLPNETVKISHGDLYIKKKGENDFTIQRKPPKKYLAMARVVHDNDYPLPQQLVKVDWPRRWKSFPDKGKGGDDAWKASVDHRSFSTDGTKEEAILQYRHYLPDDQAWGNKYRGQFVRQEYKPQLITDDCAYNSGTAGSHGGLNGLGLHWVGDLGIECELKVNEASGSVTFELIEGGRKMLCDIDLSNGMAKLTIPKDPYQPTPEEPFVVTGQTPISKPGSYRVRFVNADDELRLWVDDKVIAFDKPTVFEPLGNQIPTEADLAPVAILAKKANVEVGHLRVLRDIYYVADSEKERKGSRSGDPITDFRDVVKVFGANPRSIPEKKVRDFYQSPWLWYDAFQKGAMRDVTFPLNERQYFMLGDNSPQSKDSRLWEDGIYYVDESLLKGKAMFIYWPHSWHKVKIGDIEIPFPYFPNYERMHLVR